ncbi:MAG: DUF1772 domain-containing protein [Ilumatobacteraceae bacterium]
MTANTPTTKPTLVAEPAPHRANGDGRTGHVLAAALVLMALVAGLNFTFSAAVMPNLAGVDDRTYVVTMQRFNPNPVFPLTFTLALVLTVLAVVLLRRHGPAVRWAVAGLVLYGIVLAVTGVIHFPLNADLDTAVDTLGTVDLADVRDQHEGLWAAGNLVRTVFCTAAVATLAWALFLYGRSTPERTSGTSAGVSTWAPPATTFAVASFPSAEAGTQDRSVR